jgi:hypothetical protein
LDVTGERRLFHGRSPFFIYQERKNKPMALPIQNFTVLEQIKALSNTLYPSQNPAIVNLPTLLHQHFADKDYPAGMLVKMNPDQLRHLIFRRLLRRLFTDTSQNQLERYITELAASPQVKLFPIPAEKYLWSDSCHIFRSWRCLWRECLWRESTVTMEWVPLALTLRNTSPVSGIYFAKSAPCTG